MAEIVIECPHCLFIMEGPEFLVGEKVECPSCHNKFIVQEPGSERRDMVQTSVPGRKKRRPSFLVPFLEKMDLSHIFAGCAILISIVSLCMVLYSADRFQLKYSGSAERSFRNHLKYGLELVSNVSSFFRSNKGALLDSLLIREVIKDESTAVIFFSFSYGKEEIRDVAFFARNGKGDWTLLLPSEVQSRYPASLYINIMNKIIKFKKDHKGIPDIFTGSPLWR